MLDVKPIINTLGAGFTAGIIAWQYEKIFDGIRALWEIAGMSMVGLLPLSIMLMASLVILVKNRYKSAHFNSRIHTTLNIVVFASPMFGLLGTVLGMASSLQVIVDSKGQNSQEQITNMSANLVPAMYSTVWGMILAITAGILLHLLFKNDNSITE